MFVIKLVLASAVFYFAMPYLGLSLTLIQALMAAIVVMTAGFVMAVDNDKAVELTVLAESKTKEDD